MKQYLFSLQQPNGAPPAPDILDRIMGDLDTLNAEIKAAGAWVFAGGLHDPGSATVVKVRDGEALITDGPYTEGKEHVGGISIVQAPDLDAALAWARRLAEITTLTVEVRPFQGEA
ncbi:MAG: YciI family protein [Chloroflexota bacterium]|nr:YciI family protein [Chloroflexota bacterium]